MRFLTWHKMRYLALSENSILFFGEAMARLSAYLMGQMSFQGKSITLVDATQTFDPYLIARVGRLWGTPPRTLLERIRLSRAFTCHQLVTLLCEILPNQGMRDPVFILGPCVLFYDEQVSLKERQALFQQVASSLTFLSKRGPGCYLFQSPMARQVKNRHFGRDLAKSVQWVIRVALGEDGLEGRLLKPEFKEAKIVLGT